MSNKGIMRSSDSKRLEILEKFSEKFIKEEYIYNPILHNVVECLTRGDDPYSVIEFLIKSNEEIIKQNFELAKNNPVIYHLDPYGNTQ